MKRFRKILFWTHLVIGLAAGSVIAVVAFTGATMAFEKQVVAWAERDLRNVPPPAPGTPRLPLEKILAQVRTSHPEARPASVTVSADPTAPLILGLGRNGSLYVNPYTGEAQASGAKEVRAFFRLMLTWHRWLGVSGPPRAETAAESSRSAPPVAERSEGEDHDHGPAAGGMTARQFASSVVGMACIVFLTLCLSGLWLWWPRTWNWRSLKATSLLNFKLRGKARDWNWHNVIGLWSAPVLIVISFTGLVMAYRGFAGWIYPRPEGQPGGGPGGAAVVTVPTPSSGATRLGPDALFGVAQKEIPAWQTITLRLAGAQGRGGRGMAGRANASGAGAARPESSRPEGGGPTRSAPGAESAMRGRGPEGRIGGGEGRGRGAGGETPGSLPASISIRERGWSPMATTLQLDPFTGVVLRRAGLADLSFRQAMRTLNRTIHTGEAGGIAGQTLAFFACIGGLFLVYTGFALSWRRFFGRNSRNRAPGNSGSGTSSPEVGAAKECATMLAS